MAKLFIYGNLMNLTKPHTNWAWGVLKHRYSHDVAAKFGTQFKPHKVYGQVKNETIEEINRIKKEEKPEYDIVSIKLDDGKTAFAFEYIKKDWNKHELISSGKYREFIPKEREKMSALKKLVDLANELDQNGLYKEAGIVDGLIKNAIEVKKLENPKIVNETFKQQKKDYKQRRQQIQKNKKDRATELKALRELYADDMLPYFQDYSGSPSDLFVETFKKLEEEHKRIEHRFYEMYEGLTKIEDNIGSVIKGQEPSESGLSTIKASNDKKRLANELHILNLIHNKVSKNFFEVKQKIQTGFSDAYVQCIVIWTEILDEFKLKYLNLLSE